MKDRTKLILFTVPAMAIMCLVVGGITTLILFEAGLAQQRARLVETVKSQARLMEVIARSKAHAPDARSAAAATLVLVRDAHKEYEGLGETGEFALARKEGDSIVFLLSHRHFDLEDPKPVPFDSALAEPMRRALLGQSGT
ncbi:MAG: hypothetical protein IIB58_12925, partial [Planctomycetes bacterium]|nr:hypothetical protein [Planctomycetota bacterium]